MPTGKPIMRAMSEGVQRRALSELNTNAKVAPTPDSRGAKSTTTSPLKRRIGNVLDDDKGLKYLKRRRTSHTPVMGTVHLHTAATRKRDNVEKAQANKETARFRPLPQSTRSRDNRSAVHDRESTEPETQSESEESGSGSQKSTATKASFSSLINYDPSSQQALGGMPPPHRTPARVSTQTQAPQPESDLYMAVSSKAEMLRLRLKVAMYKVRTNQINVPFARLRIERPEQATTESISLDPAITRGPASRAPNPPPVSPPRIQPTPAKKNQTPYSTLMQTPYSAFIQTPQTIATKAFPPSALQPTPAPSRQSHPAHPLSSSPIQTPQSRSMQQVAPESGGRTSTPEANRVAARALGSDPATIGGSSPASSPTEVGSP
ncbi:hypothetical protein H2203_004901 [Taxawa tesnikishii (nom. ined.)]|nr:hypothetical protein H2203_004901 [Dothideales sp. JES 119]